MHMYLPSPMYGPNMMHCNGETNPMYVNLT